MNQAAIEFDASQAFRNESTWLDPHDITLIVDPSIDPFAHYVNRMWPLTFGIVIYKVHRNGNAIATVDNGHGNQVPAVDVAFIGYLDADDTLDTNSAGLEVTIEGRETEVPDEVEPHHEGARPPGATSDFLYRLPKDGVLNGRRIGRL